MKKVILLAALFVGLGCSAQFFNNDVSRKYFYHWESINPVKVDMEIIIHREGNVARVTEIKYDHSGETGRAIVYTTVYVCRNKKNRIVVETVNPSTLQINDSEYVLTKNKRLLRITNRDTITFQRRY